MAKDNCFILIIVELQDHMQLESSQTNLLLLNYKIIVLKKEVETMQRIHYAFSQYYHAIEIAFIYYLQYSLRSNLVIKK
jgi:hypothetical protein